MNITNFDQSSTGLNLELVCCYDTDLSQIYFDDNFTRLNDDLWVYTEHGNVSDDFSLSDAENYQFTVSEFKQAFVNAGYDKELSQYSFSKSFSKLTKAELIELLENQAYGSDEIAEFYQDNFKPLFDIIVTKGHCQGDYAKVIITPAFRQFLKANGHDYDDKARRQLSDTIDNLFWNTPVYCRLTLDDDIEFYLDEHLADLYCWDKNSMINNFTTRDTQYNKLDESQKAIIAEFLTANLPEQPDYN